MRRALFVSLTASVLAGAVAAWADAAPPRKTITSHCSSSGDVCFGVINKAGAVYFEITTAARYFNRYRLCVRPPGTAAAGRWRCGSYPVRHGGPNSVSSVKFAGRFPYVGPGVYRVKWSLGSQALGPTLRFRLPLR
jgi:hypothetical protein